MLRSSKTLVSSCLPGQYECAARVSHSVTVSGAAVDQGLLQWQGDMRVLKGMQVRILSTVSPPCCSCRKEPSRGINPDEAVAYGAAVQAGILSGEGGQVMALACMLHTDAWANGCWAANL
eukprot:4190375-Amphidinium_carterae.1